MSTREYYSLDDIKNNNHVIFCEGDTIKFWKTYINFRKDITNLILKKSNVSMTQNNKVQSPFKDWIEYQETDDYISIKFLKSEKYIFNMCIQTFLTNSINKIYIDVYKEQPSIFTKFMNWFQ